MIIICVGGLKDQEEKGICRRGFSKEELIELSSLKAGVDRIKDDIRSQIQMIKIMIVGKGAF